VKALGNKDIYGNWATLLLTTDPDGSIDFLRLSDEIDVLLASNPNGIYSNGTAGEFYAQTEDEFDKVSMLLSEKCEQAGIPYQFGVSHMSPQISLERLKRIRDLKPGAVQLILPDWFPPTLEESVIFLERMQEEADGTGLVLYNPPHAKKKIHPDEWSYLKDKVPGLVGMKVFDNNRDPQWYKMMKPVFSTLSVFIPGHHLVTGIKQGAQGSYSNVACLNPFAAQRWYELSLREMDAALELEGRIQNFMKLAIEPFITKHHYANHACDRFMAMVGGWVDVGSKLRWPYRSIPEEAVGEVRKVVRRLIPEFLEIS